MKRNAIMILLLSSLMFWLIGCSSNNDESKSTESMDQVAGDSKKSESVTLENTENFADGDATEAVETSSRMVIHQAQLQLNVKNLEKIQSKVEKKVTEYGGYIVESNVYREDKESIYGTMTVRIPENHFQKFLLDAEGEATKVLERSVTGQDVTEQYVDMESRLKSKRAVEERLLDFMSKAEKTEDLLKISTDLAEVQEEIEQIVGQMKFLENQTAYSTINISMNETTVAVPSIDNKDLNTWDKTKKQFATSMNFLLAAGSGLIVFVIGNLPALLILLVVGGIVYFVYKRKDRGPK